MQSDNNPQPSQPEQAPTPSPEQPRNDAPPASKTGVSRKAAVVALGVALLVIAILIAMVLALALNRGNSNDQTANTGGGGTSQNDDNNDSSNDTSAPRSARVVAKVQSQQEDVEIELLEPRKVGNTMVVNYNLVNTSTENRKFTVGARQAGVYTIRWGISSEYSNGGGRTGTAEPYAIANNDGQKYGLARDDKNQPLASNQVESYISPGQKISGYVTLSLPPSGTTMSVFLGDASAANDVTIKY